MKRSIVLLVLTIIFADVSAQQAPAYSKGQSTISLGYGIGNIWKTFLDDVGGKVTATGPVALTYDYGIHKRISVGLSLGYSIVHNKVTYNSYTVTEKLTNFSAILLANYHFGHAEKFDPYIGGGLGYYDFRYSSSETFRKVNPSAFGFSGQLGCKYYFTPSFGAYIEAGYVGGSIVQLGATFKF